MINPIEISKNQVFEFVHSHFDANFYNYYSTLILRALYNDKYSFVYEKSNSDIYLSIIYKCNIREVENLLPDSNVLGLYFTLLPNKYIYAGIIVEKDGKLYSPDRVKYYFNYSGDMHQLLGAVRKDLMFCKYCNHRTEKLYINDFVNNTYNYCFISCKDCSNTIHKKQIAESVNDKLGIIL